MSILLISGINAGAIDKCEWIELKSKYKGIEQDESLVPDWHKNVVRERLEEYWKHPGEALDFDNVMDKIEKSL
jgi:hypothetical protein